MAESTIQDSIEVGKELQITGNTLHLSLIHI